MNKPLLILLTSIITINLNAVDANRDLRRTVVSATARLGNIAVAQDEHGFAVIKDGRAHRVPPYMVDKTLRGKSPEDIRKFLSQNNYLKVKQNERNEFSIESGVRGLGGGAGGFTAGFFVGKFLTHAVGQGLIQGVTAGVAVVFPPAAPSVELALQATFLPVIESTSNAIGMGCAIALGAATGPV